MKKLLLILSLAVCTIANAQYTKLLDFAGATSGSQPHGDLISDGTFLYGMTREGGTNNMGTIFKIMPDGTGYVKLLDFAGATNGRLPYGTLVSDGTFLYGTTQTGGTNDYGTIFKIMPDGTGYVKLLDFAGATNGQYPTCTLISDGTFFYGVTRFGGTNNYGTIFKIMPDGTGYVKLLDFDGANNGRDPYGSLTSDGTFLYGMTDIGGTNNMGVLFKIIPDGTGYVKLLDFDGATKGSFPYGSVVSDGTFLYGMTDEGGTNDMGTIFKIMPDGTGYVKLLDFDGAVNGSYPMGSLVSDGTFLYGTTAMGGTNDMGTIFKIMPDGTGYVKLLDFDGANNGRDPYGSLVSDGTFLYGMARQGGTANKGTIFKSCVPTTGTDVQTACGTYTWVDGNTYTSSNNSATHTLTSVAGCDSVITLNLTINTSTTSTDVQTACGTYTWIDGNTYTSSNITATHILTNAAGCDSVVTLNLTVNTVDVTVTDNSPVLWSNAPTLGHQYQWIDCNNGNAPLVGETYQGFTAPTNGDYAVIVTGFSETCTDTSACVNITGVGINETTTNIVSIYPNPTNNLFTITLDNMVANTQITVVSIEGKEVFNNNTLTTNKIVVDATNWSKGVYVVKINNNQYNKIVKLIKE